MAVNGRSYDFESATFKASGLTTTTIVNATYAGGRNVEIKTDTKGAPSRYTLGDYDGGEVTFEIAKAEAVQFLESLEEVPGGGILGAQFTATISYAGHRPRRNHRHSGACVPEDRGQAGEGQGNDDHHHLPADRADELRRRGLDAGERGAVD